MNSVKKTIDQLKKELSQKVKGIETILSQALKCELESDERIECSNIIASSLRAVLWGDRHNGFKSLVERVGLDRKLLFPIYSYASWMNIMPTYNLLQFSISEAGTKVSIINEVFKTGGMWSIYLTFDSWLNEVVIDTKLKDVEPLSRLSIVKIIADTAGAHVDDNVEKHVFEMSKHDLLPVVVKDGIEIPRNLEVKTQSIFCETLLAIAKELVDSYETWTRLSSRIIGPSDKVVRLQRYLNGKTTNVSLKYCVLEKNLPFEINAYNSNAFFECDVFSKEVSRFEAARNNWRFGFIKIDYKEIIKGEFLGKSIYPR